MNVGTWNREDWSDNPMDDDRKSRETGRAYLYHRELTAPWTTPSQGEQGGHTYITGS